MYRHKAIFKQFTRNVGEEFQKIELKCFFPHKEKIRFILYFT